MAATGTTRCPTVTDVTSEIRRKTKYVKNGIRLSRDALSNFINAARDDKPVSGLTHSFYKYPARFSPRFVRTAIEIFSSPGDLVLDPFMGGGTTLVEALALGRHAAGADISSLATFIARVKTANYSDVDLDAVDQWSDDAAKLINMHAERPISERHDGQAYLRNLDGQATWRMRKCIEQALASAVQMSNRKRVELARCIVLSSAQWALDGRSRGVPTVSEFRNSLPSNARDMIVGAREFRDFVKSRASTKVPAAVCMHRSASGLETDPRMKRLAVPSLILTSPPYPGVHVLYHRWQVDGRKETPAPFWIADQRDGSGESYYTLGSRKAPKLKNYFDNLRASMKSIAAVCSRDTLILQIVAFSQPSWQLPRYLSVVDDAGLAEYFLDDISDSPDGRLWRSVPNRKWHADQKGQTSGSNEVVFFHRLK
jgi:DNA modification methylase